MISERMRYLLDVEPAVRKAKQDAETRWLRNLLAGEMCVMGARVRLEFVDDCGLTRDQLVEMLDRMLA